MKNLINKIEQNQETIASYGKIDLSVLNKINYKIRLDWNYYSNRMEGGTLTKAETRSVMVQNIDVKGKPFKDVAEMQGHDNIVLDVLKIGKGELRISEARIKEIHKAIMYESNPEKAKQIGVWKTESNEIINYKGEKFGFVKPSQVADAIHDLLNNTNAELDKYFQNKSKKHAIEIATEFHLNFLTIHPFYDGNGRVARILTNLILISCSYPAVIIKENEKKSYYNLLADIQCYGGNVDLLENFFSERLLESQNLVIDALNGKDISEEDDLDKKLEILKQRIDSGIQKTVPKLTYKIFFDVFNEWINPLLDELIKTTIKFNKFYSKPKHEISLILNDKDEILNNKWNISFDLTPNYNDLLSIVSHRKSENLVKGGQLQLIAKFGNDESKFADEKQITSFYQYLTIGLSDTTFYVSIEEDNKLHKDLRFERKISEEEIKEINKIWSEKLLIKLENNLKNK